MSVHNSASNGCVWNFSASLVLGQAFYTSLQISDFHCFYHHYISYSLFFTRFCFHLFFSYFTFLFSYLWVQQLSLWVLLFRTTLTDSSCFLCHVKRWIQEMVPSTFVDVNKVLCLRSSPILQWLEVVNLMTGTSGRPRQPPELFLSGAVVMTLCLIVSEQAPRELCRSLGVQLLQKRIENLQNRSSVFLLTKTLHTASEH